MYSIIASCSALAKWSHTWNCVCMWERKDNKTRSNKERNKKEICSHLLQIHILECTLRYNNNSFFFHLTHLFTVSISLLPYLLTLLYYSNFFFSFHSKFSHTFFFMLCVWVLEQSKEEVKEIQRDEK
jgi:hypothetical protein